jgi:hypothetical protein
LKQNKTNSEQTKPEQPKQQTAKKTSPTNNKGCRGGATPGNTPHGARRTSRWRPPAPKVMKTKKKNSKRKEKEKQGNKIKRELKLS